MNHVKPRRPRPRQQHSHHHGSGGGAGYPDYHGFDHHRDYGRTAICVIYLPTKDDISHYPIDPEQPIIRASFSRSKFARPGLPNPGQNGDLAIPFEQKSDLLNLGKGELERG